MSSPVEAPLITTEEAELARQRALALEAKRVEAHVQDREAFEGVEVESLREHKQLQERLQAHGESTFDDHMDKIQDLEDDMFDETPARRVIGRLLLRPRHQPDRVKAYDEYVKGITKYQEDAVRKQRQQKPPERYHGSAAAERDKLLSDLRRRFEEPEKSFPKLRKTAEKVRQNPKIRRIGEFVVSDLPNILGPSLPERHEFLSDHYQHYLETLQQEEDAHANGTLTPAEKLAAKAREREALEAFVKDEPYIDKLYQMIGRETNKAKLLELNKAMGWLTNDLHQVGIEIMKVDEGDPVDLFVYNVVRVIGQGEHEVVDGVERLGFQMTDGKLIRPAEVTVRRYSTEAEKLQHDKELAYEDKLGREDRGSGSSEPTIEKEKLDSPGERRPRRRGRRGSSNIDREPAKTETAKVQPISDPAKAYQNLRDKLGDQF